MKIYSWNVYFRSRSLNKAFEYIKKLDFDVLCLQEVPENFLKRLQALPFHFVSNPDVTFFSRRKVETIHTVILSRHPIAASGTITFSDITLPRRASLALKARSGWSGFRDRGAVYADINTGKATIRIFSLHLTLTSPSDRKNEFERVKSFIPENFPTILAGDFNIIEHSLIKPLNWFTGATLSESVPWHRERKHSEKRFKEIRLKNPLRGKVTHRFSHSQLDHILVPEGATIVKAEVIKQTYGSDHHPVFVEIEEQIKNSARAGFLVTQLSR